MLLFSSLKSSIFLFVILVYLTAASVAVDENEPPVLIGEVSCQITCLIHFLKPGFTVFRTLHENFALILI